MACKVHKVRFYNPKPRAVHSLSFNDVEKWLALSREDASIEIWDMKYAPYLLKWIPGVENGSVEALGWIKRRLLSTGLGGALVEWDLDTLTSKWSTLLTGYAAWCLAVDSERRWVAVGTEQGYLNLFRVQGDSIKYEKLFDKQEGRIICCQFDKTGNVLVTGSVGTIRIWDVETGHARHRLVTSRRGKVSLVWSLAVLSDLTVVAGESDGRLTFWDGNVAEQIESFPTHKGDVLAVTVSADECTVYCSGVDPAIVTFTRVARDAHGSEARLHWVKSVQRNVHEHDVRALAVQGKRLISLGADGYLALSSYPPKWLLRVPPLPPTPRVCAAATPQHKLLMLRYTSHLEMWKLGKYATNKHGKPIFTGEDKFTTKSTKTKVKLEEDSASLTLNLQAFNQNSRSSVLDLADRPVKLVSIRAKGNQQIKCCALSPNGQYIMYSTEEVTRLFHLELDGEEANLLRLPMMAEVGKVGGCSRAVFTRDSRTLLLHTASPAVAPALAVLHLDPSTGATLHHRVATAPYLKGGCALHLVCDTVSHSGTTYAVCADSGGGVAVWRRCADKALFTHHVTLPTYHCVPSALAVCPATENLLIVYVDQKLMEFDLQKLRFSEWPEQRLPEKWWKRDAAVSGIAPHPQRPHLLLFHDDTSVWLLDKQRLMVDNSSGPVSKKKSGDEKKAKIKIFPFKYLAGWAWFEGEEALAVEVLPENIISQLPPVLATKRFSSL